MSRERIDSIERRIDSDVLTITTAEGTKTHLPVTDPDVQAFMRARERLHPAAPTSWYLDVRLVDAAHESDDAMGEVLAVIGDSHPHDVVTCIVADLAEGGWILVRAGGTEPREDPLRVLREALVVASEFAQPGPDGQDYIDRGRMRDAWIEEARDRVEYDEDAAGGTEPRPEGNADAVR